MSLNPVYLKTLLLHDYHWFVRYFFKQRYGRKIQDAPHVKILCDTLQKCIDGEIQNLIINIAPGFSKSMIGGEFLVPFAMARNKYAKNIILSYGQTVSQKTSQSAKNIMQLPEYQKFFPQKFQIAENSKGFWRNEYGGGLLATSAGGAVTGHDAGSISSDADDDYDFDGMLIFDDPQKPDNIHSEHYRDSVNRLYLETVKSRLRNPKAPKIIIMQRLHPEDLTHFLLTGGSEDKWHHLILPVEIKENYEYPDIYTHGIPIQHNLPVGALWDYKLPLEKIQAMRVATPYLAAAQYDQDPIHHNSDYFRDEWLRYYEQAPDSLNIYGASDYALTEGGGDYTVHGVFGVDSQDNIYVLDWWRKQCHSAEWVSNLIRLIKLWNPIRWFEEGGTIIKGLKPFIDKEIISNNAYVMRQSIQYGNQNKEARAQGISGRFQMGKIFLPKNAPWVIDLKREMLTFPNGKHDDQVDVLSLLGMGLNQIFTAVDKKEKINDIKTDDYTPRRKSIFNSQSMVI